MANSRSYDGNYIRSFLRWTRLRNKSYNYPKPLGVHIEMKACVLIWEVSRTPKYILLWVVEIKFVVRSQPKPININAIHGLFQITTIFNLSILEINLEEYRLNLQLNSCIYNRYKEMIYLSYLMADICILDSLQEQRNLICRY